MSTVTCNKYSKNIYNVHQFQKQAFDSAIVRRTENAERTNKTKNGTGYDSREYQSGSEIPKCNFWKTKNKQMGVK